MGKTQVSKARVRLRAKDLVTMRAQNEGQVATSQDSRVSNVTGAKK
jgi:hypothetical protein